MFENLSEKKQTSTKFKLLAVGSGVLHIAVGTALLFMGMWKIEEIARPNRQVLAATFVVSGSEGGKSQKSAEPKALVKPKKKIVKDQVQPDARKRDKPDPRAESTNESGDGKGEGTGKGSGKGPGTGTGTGDIPGPGKGPLGIEICITDCDGAPSVPKTEVKVPPKFMPTVLSQLKRISGESKVQPPSSTKNRMHQKHTEKIVAGVKMCLDKSGAVNRQNIVKSSGYPEYDAKLLSAVRRWRYQPYRANGNAIAICTLVTFVYEQ